MRYNQHLSITRFKLPIIVFACLAPLLVNSMFYLSGDAVAADNLTILYSSDTQGYIRSCGGCPKEEELGGLARRATYLKPIEGEVSNAILVDVGDVLSDMKESEKKAEVIFKSMSRMGYDAVNLGEMDFSSGRTALEREIQTLKLPVISANIVDEETGRLFAPQPYVIKTLPNGLKVGIIGVLSDKFPIQLPLEEKRRRVVPPVEALQRYLTKVKENSDLVIVLSHLGIFDSTDLARSVGGVNVIISGHGGHGIEKPILVNDTIVVQTKDKGTHLGRLDLTLDENGKIISYNNQLIPLGEQYKDDQTILNILDEYKEPVVAKWDAGDVKEGETYEKVIEIKNTGPAPLVVHKARPSCECLSAGVVKKMANPGEAATIRAKLVVNDLNREFEKYIYIQSNDAKQPVAAIAVSGKIIGEMKSEKEGTKDEEQSQKTGKTESQKAGKPESRKAGKPAISSQQPYHSPLTTHQTEVEPLRVILFYFPGCRGCYKIKDLLLPQMEEKYGKKVQIEKYDISDMSNYELLMKFEDRYGVKEDSPMVLFVGDKYFAGSKAIERHLDEAIEDILSSGVGMMAESVPTWRAVQNIEANTSQKHLGTVGSEESVANVRPKLIERFRTFSLMAVLGAGLVDGINPCAFVTIVFFISVLTYKGRKKKELLIVGSFFSLSVFLVYLMLGVGVFKVFQKLEIYRTLSRFLYCGIIAGVFILGIYSLYDCFIYMKTKKAKDIKLQLPRRIKHRIHAVISKNFRTRGLVTAAVITGTSVSILESVCTGQVYLPTIVFLTREPSLRMQAYSYLVLYNLMFIVPLVIVFLLAYAGVGWERFAKFSEKHVSLSKLLLAGMFFGLGTALLVTG